MFNKVGFIDLYNHFFNIILISSPHIHYPKEYHEIHTNFSMETPIDVEKQQLNNNVSKRKPPKNEVNCWKCWNTLQTPKIFPTSWRNVQQLKCCQQWIPERKHCSFACSREFLTFLEGFFAWVQGISRKLEVKVERTLSNIFRPTRAIEHKMLIVMFLGKKLQK